MMTVKMRHPDGLRVAMTGAAGFIGRAVVESIASGAMGQIAELRLNDVAAVDVPGAKVVRGNYADNEVRSRLVADGVDVLFHLASLPGGASERDPVLGKRVNLDGSIALLDAVAEQGTSIIVYASSIAALGRHAAPVTDATALRPAGSYGTHKAMIEFYLADLTRRGVVDGRAVRPVGIVARPQDTFPGFATAWMSDLFHAAVEGRPITIPSRADAQIWLQSVDAVADNIVHAALMPITALPPHRTWTLPAIVLRVDELIDALNRHTGHALEVEYGDGATDQPPLDTAGALALGFKSDRDTDALVHTVMNRIKRQPLVVR